MKNILLLLAVTALIVGSLGISQELGKLASSSSAAQITNEDVGPPKGRSTLLATNSGFVMNTIGGSRSSTAEKLQFAHRSWTGDVAVIARVWNLKGSEGMGKAGLAIRRTAHESSPEVMLTVDSGNRIAFERRAADGEIKQIDAFEGGASRASGARASAGPASNWRLANAQSDAVSGFPRWLKLVRRGDEFSAYESNDGAAWNWIGTERVPLGSDVEIGIVTSGGGTSEAASSQLDHFTVSNLTAAKAHPFVGSGEGLLGTYLDSKGTNQLQRIDANIKFLWGPKRPLSALTFANLHAEWEGYLQGQHSEPYAIQLVHDGKVRMWLDGELVVDDWEEGQLRQNRVLSTLVSGAKHPVRIEFASSSAHATIDLRWSSPSTPRQSIPSSQLSVNAAPDARSAVGSDLSAGTAALRVSDGLANLREPWLNRVLGIRKNAAQMETTNEAFFVTVGGSGPGKGVDEGSFTYQLATGDAEISARVVGLQTAENPTRMGVMIRDSLDVDGRAVFLLVNQLGRSHTFFRKDPNQGQVARFSSSASPWLKLARRGDTFTSYTSGDGVNWAWQGSVELPMGDTVAVGFCIGTSDSDRAFTARVDDVHVSSAVASSPVIGSGDGLDATYSDESKSHWLSRIDPEINFVWGSGSPLEAVEKDSVVARWEGLVEAQYSERYRLQIFSDGDVTIWFDGKRYTKAPAGSNRREKMIGVSLEAGHLYPIRIEYSHPSANSTMRLFWSSARTGKTPIPQSQLYSSTNSAAARARDKDHDGMPDDWELAHGLDPFDAADAALDPDEDGLTNLQEYQAGTDPQNRDTDGDGLPDGWEVAHGLNPLDPTDAARDDDHDGLTNLQEYLADTDPHDADTDGDGIPDGVEVNEIRSDPLVADTTAITTVTEVAGSQNTASLGSWVEAGSSLYCTSGRGWVEYTLTAPRADMYRLEVTGASRIKYDTNPDFELQIWIDGEYLERSILRALQGASGLSHVMTPWIGAGEHRIRIFWDNGLQARSLEITALRLQSLDGPDADGDGVKDWVRKRLTGTCSIDVAPQNSAVSPACIEGTGRYLSMMTISGGVKPQAGAGSHWYADVPLSVNTPTAVTCSFQNGALRITKEIVWKPTNLLQADDLTIRAGDALLLVAKPGNGGAGNGTGGQMQISIAGVTNYTSSTDSPVVHRFVTPGRYSVSAKHIGAAGRATSGRSVTVTVVSGSLGSEPATWSGKWRLWDCPVPDRASLQTDSAVGLNFIESVTNGVSKYTMTLRDPEVHHVVARVGTNGPVVAQVAVPGFRFFSADELGIHVVNTYADGSQLVEMGMILSPVLPDVSVRIEVYAGGVIFDDGTVVKELTAKDFDNLGKASVRFVRPPTFKTAVCHQTTVLQGKTVLGVYP